MALKDQDQIALAELFEREDKVEIEADITECLLLLWPELCWGENPYDFLRDYL